MTTIRDVAERCGLSAMTVSAVLNNRPGFAAPETRARVLRVVEEMGYQPNAVARSFRRQRMNTLGVVMSHDQKLSLTSDRYFSPVLDGIFKANKQHQQKTLIITEDTAEAVQQNLLGYADGHCDGLIFILPLLPSDAFLPLLKRQIPLVLIGESRPEEELSVVDLDNVQAAFNAVGHLTQRGHRKIAYFSGNERLLSAHQREAGYRQAFAAGGIPVEERWVLPGKYQIDSGYERMRFLCGLPKELRPTAVFCADDYIAQGARQALAELGVPMPEGMSLVGINDNQDVSTREPGLTTIRQPLHLFGKRAVEIALRQIDKKSSAGEKILIRGELIVRGSVAPLPSS